MRITIFFLVVGTLPLAAQIRERVQSRVVSGPSITCRFDASVRVEYIDGQIVHGIPAREKEPIIFSFTGLGTKTPKIRGLGAATTTYEPDWSPVQIETNAKFVLIEVTPIEKNVFVYTIWKKTGVATWVKSYPFPMDEPTGHVSMGKCQ